MEANWATLVITKNEPENQAAMQIICKDFTGGMTTNEVEPFLSRIFSGEVELIVNSEGKFPSSESAALSLKWMQMMVEGLQSPDRHQFISEFPSIALTSEELDVGKLKTDLKIDLVSHTINVMLNEMEDDQDANKMIGSFLEFCKIARDKLGKQVSTYEKILKEEMAKLEEDPQYEMDEEKIMNAQKELQDNLGKDNQAELDKLIKKAIPQYQNLAEEPKDGKDGQDEDKDSDNNSKQEEKKSFQVFRNCIRLLRGAEETEKLRKLLNSIEDKFGLMSGALSEYFHAQEKEEIALAEDPDSSGSLGELVSMLPAEKKNVSSSPDPKVKSMDQLLAELAEEKELNSEDLGEEGLVIFQQKYLGNQEVLEMKEDYDEVMEHFEKWKDADVPTINSWANKIRGHLDSYAEGIAVMDRVFQLTTGGFRMRDPQLFSVIWFLRQGEDSGKLAQISTGEGKTLIIGALSSLAVLRGNKVDVLTSNEVLAQEGVDEMRSFYKILGISVATNNGEETASKKQKKFNWGQLLPRACYFADIVYGTITSFQFDYLRDTSEGKQTRGNRPFGIVILDEVDNLSVDNGGHIAKLAKPFPGMECLKYICIKIWQELAKAEEKVGEDYLKKLEEKKKELEEKEKTLEAEVEVEGQDLEEEYEKYQIQLIANFFDELKLQIKASNPCDTDLIHHHLRPFCQSMLEKWIDNALFAKYECREREMYIIKKVGEDDAIVPVDYANTGVTMEKTQWSNGLHQFVQLKHNLRLTCESLTSSFISNIGYIKLYKSENIFGLTGTLGSLAAREMLHEAYNVSFRVFPRYKTYNLAMLESMAVLDSHWANLVTMEAVLEAVGRNRAVLIICKTIKDMELISKNVRACLDLEEYAEDFVKVKTYLDEDESEVVKDKVGLREIIIATNIAGRGTNFKTTKELEAAGGLHVIVSFLPYNKRVQDQAFGRTARQGNQGSAQLILRKQDVLEIDVDPDDKNNRGSLTMDKILEKRDEIEKNRLQNIKEKKLPEINFNDELFTKFSDLSWAFTSRTKEITGSSYVVEDLKEFWAFWLHKQDYSFDKIKSTTVQDEFKQFSGEADVLLRHCQIIWNPFNEIRRGDNFLHINDLNNGEQAVRRGIQMSKDDGLCASGYMKLFDIEIEKGAQLMERFKKALAKVLFIPLEKDEIYKVNAKAALEKAVVGLEKEVSHLRAILITEGEANQDFQRILIYKAEGKNLLLTHLNGRLAALSTFHEHAKSLLQSLTEKEGNKTIGLAMGSKIPHYLKTLDGKSDERKLKEALTSGELDELQWIGLETIYALRDVHDAHEATIIGAQVQIAAGLACLAGGYFFPPALAILGPIAGALISEGVCDIVMELLSRGYTGFDVKSYVKGKCISFGIALATMGISAVATSVKMLDKAAKACRSLASLLRKCPYLKGVCEKLAKQMTTLATYFDKLKLTATFSKMKDADKLKMLKELRAAGEIEKLKQLGGLTKLGQLEHLESLGKLDVISRTQLLKSAVISVGRETVQSVTMSLITEHLVTAGLNLILEQLRPLIEVRVREGLDKGKLRDPLEKVEDRSQVETLTMEVLEGDWGKLTGEVIQEIALGMARQSGNWKLKLSSLGLDTALSLAKILKYTDSFCERFKVAVASKYRSEGNSDLTEKEDLDLDAPKAIAGSDSNMNKKEDLEAPKTITGSNSDLIEKEDLEPLSTLTENNSDLNEKVDLVATLVTDKVYGLIMELAGKHAATIVVGPLMSKALSLIGNEKKNVEVDEANEKTLADIKDAYETLKLSPGGSLEDLKKAYKKASLQTHPDRQGGSKENFLRVIAAYKFILKLHSDLASPSPSGYRPKNPLLLGLPAGRTNTSSDSPISSNNPGDGGKIATISQHEKHHITVRCFDETGLRVIKVKEYGEKYKDNGNPSVLIGFYPPTLKNSGKGHFIPLAKDDSPIPTKIYQPSSGNSCLYEAIAPQIKGGAMTPQALRLIGEKFSLSNVKYAVANIAVDLLKNPITMELYLKGRRSLLVGGSVEKTIKATQKFTETLGDMKEIKRQTILGTSTSMSLHEACKGDLKAIKAIQEHSPKNISEKTVIQCYNISGIDSLTNFILNYKHDKIPFVLRYRNGTKSVFAGNLYSMVAYKDTGYEGTKKEKPKVGDTRYHENFGETALDSLKALTDPNSRMPVDKYFEISGRLISESIRHHATFMSLCWALAMNSESKVAGSLGKDNHGNWCVTTGTGIIWPQSDRDYKVVGARNPLWLLDQHIEKSKSSKIIYKMEAACVRRIYKNYVPLADIQKLKDSMTPEQEKTFKTLFNQMLYRRMRYVLTKF